MAKKPAKAKAAKKAAKPAKKAVKSASSAKPKKAAKPAPAKPAAKSSKVVKPVKKAAKPVVKAKAKPAGKAKAKPLKPSKPAKAVKAIPKKSVKPIKVAKATAKPIPKSKPAPAKAPVKKIVPPAKAVKQVVSAKPSKTEEVKVTPKAIVAKVEPKTIAAEPAPAAEPKKEQVKTVEQQMQEKSNDADTSKTPVKGKEKEELFVPKYSLPPVVEIVRPMRPKPPVFTDAPVLKPVANPIYVPPAPDGKAGVKFAPIAVVERPKEKEKPNNKSEEEDMSSKTSPRLAFNESDDKKGISVEGKLRALYALQLIDSRIDKIHAMRGELPLEVQDLEDDVAGLETRLANLTGELKSVTDDVAAKKQAIKDSEALIKKYKEQLENVKNNREFDSLNKEIEFQDLEIQLHNKRIKESDAMNIQKQSMMEMADTKLKERKGDLKVKRTELDEIVNSTEKEEKVLRKKSDEAKQLIEARLVSAYERIRSGAPNGMAVVPIEREASAGSFIQLPPQKQLDVAARKRVIVDEHSGRILVDADLAKEEQEKMELELSKLK